MGQEAMKTKNVKIVQSEIKEEQIERNILAAHIITISDVLQKLERGISREAIVILLADRTKLGKGEVRDFLHDLENLRRDFVR